jgi:1,5-anhydro-D-fructose reductase (1,5-anhydro-D-mannitol-forming)
VQSASEDRSAVGWGIVGLGGIARRMGRAIGAAAGARLAAVASRDPAKAERFAAEFGAGSHHGSYDALLGDPSVEVVYVATPNALHGEQTVQALEAGKHVLVEKPMALSVADARRMVEAAARLDRLVGVGFQLRYHPVHAELRKLLASGEVGELVHAEAVWGSYVPSLPRTMWQMDPELAGAGSVTALGVHLVDTVRFVTGLEVTAVGAIADGPSDRWPLDFLTAFTLVLSDGSFAQCLSSRRLPFGRNSVVAYARKARLEGRSTLSMEPLGELVLTRTGDETVTRRLPLRDLYQLEVEGFSSAVRGEGEVLATGEDGVRSVEVTEAILEASRTGRLVPVDRGGYDA